MSKLTFSDGFISSLGYKCTKCLWDAGVNVNLYSVAPFADHSFCCRPKTAFNLLIVIFAQAFVPHNITS